MKPPSSPGSQEIPRRSYEIPGVGRRRPGEPETTASTETTAAESETPSGEHQSSPRRLIVGREISLTGEINSCDHLVVEGRIEAKLKDCRTIEVADGGFFKGSAEIEQADIGGRFDGDLSVRGRLMIRGSGVISGEVRYGELEVEVGGRLIGNVSPLEAKANPLSDAGLISQIRDDSPRPPAAAAAAGGSFATGDSSASQS